MIPVLLAWTLTASVWTLGSSQFQRGDPVNVLYPAISSDETIDCECVNIFCDNVYWFRTVPTEGKLEFLGKCNNAERVTYGEVNITRYKFSKRGGASFVLRILGVTEADAGIYSCVLKDSRKETEIFRPGFLLRPGETPPTIRPTTKPRPKMPCRCKKHPQGSCDSRFLWPLVGLAAGLVLAILFTLYYFSRLPKKCHHHFVKKRLMT
ncbi:signal-regulatory protein gamma [Odontesthes bonariensis]|uniref:signal-regulatory protein gamma n=1 Tax=Odontesthes bonariensis TaxID=219752 RepID=UPI003F5882E9